METVGLQVNGVFKEIVVDPSQTLLKTLRSVLRLTGTKCGCETGDCGACMVLIDGEAVRSCLVKTSKLSGREVVTIEGITGEMRKTGALHPIQQAFVEAGAVQCGFCTPGMIISAKALLDKNPNPSREEVIAAIDKNLCRCTGYVKIVDAVLLAAEKMGGKGNEVAENAGEGNGAAENAGRCGNFQTHPGCGGESIGTEAVCG